MTFSQHTLFSTIYKTFQSVCPAFSFIIESLPNIEQVLAEDTILFLDNQQPLGVLFETLGSVKLPVYSVRMKPSDIKALHAAGKLEPDETLIYSYPEMDMLTKFVFTKRLEREKGTDASWRDDMECHR